MIQYLQVKPLPKELQRWRDKIEKVAGDQGLDFFHTIFEVVSYDKMNEIAAYDGFPTRYPHWRFGMAYEHQVVKFNSIELRQNLFYLLSIILIHHLILFGMETFDISKISLVIKNTFKTAIFTLIAIYILFELIIKRAK